jgi:endoglucanase
MRRRKTGLRGIAALSALTTLLVAACGSSGDPNAPAGGSGDSSNTPSGGSTSPSGGGSTSPSGGGVSNPDGRPTPETSGKNGAFRVNRETGRVMHNGVEFQVRGGNWFGLEGQDDTARPGAMELFIGSVWWVNDASAKRTIEKTMQEIKTSGLGFNTIRLPIAPQTLVANHPDGNYSTMSPRISNNDPSFYPYANARAALEDFIKKADQNNIYIILGVHSCSNHVGWRKGRLNDAPPYVDSDRPNYEHKADAYTCASGEDEYNVDKWLATIKEMAQLPKKLGVKNILGIDCFNEPWKYSWPQWADMAKMCYDTIAAENDDIIAVIEGVSGSHETAEHNKMEPEDHGDLNLNPNWGENILGQSKYPIQIPRDRLCFSPHTYGPSVFVQKHHVDQSKPECVGLEDDAAAEKKCQLVVDRDNATAVAALRKGWDEHFGYLHDEKYCVLIGEFGGTKDWPKNELEPAAATQWAHLPAGARHDWEWQNIFVDYLKDRGITDFTYWSINPESGDTGGLYNHKYTNADKSGWGTWTGLDTEKVNMLQGLR